MTKTVKYCYCDILEEHNGEKVDGASTYNDITVMVYDRKTSSISFKNVTLDMCPACYAKYKSNLYANYDYQGNPYYSFGNNS